MNLISLPIRVPEKRRQRKKDTKGNQGSCEFSFLQTVPAAFAQLSAQTILALHQALFKL